jgi:hypothetical protein
MKIEKNFTTGVLSGICGILVLVVMMGSTTPETTTKFEFHDLGDTRGLIFNKVTGQMEYKEIRTEPNVTNSIVSDFPQPFIIQLQGGEYAFDEIEIRNK